MTTNNRHKTLTVQEYWNLLKRPDCYLLVEYNNNRNHQTIILGAEKIYFPIMYLHRFQPYMEKIERSFDSIKLKMTDNAKGLVKIPLGIKPGMNFSK